MKKLSQRTIDSYAHLSEGALDAFWKAIDLSPANRVKGGRNKGQLKLSAIRRSDEVLAVLRHRRAADKAATERALTAINAALDLSTVKGG